MQDACWERGSQEKMGETEAVSWNQPPWAPSSPLHQSRGRHRPSGPPHPLPHHLQLLPQFICKPPRAPSV